MPTSPVSTMSNEQSGNPISLKDLTIDNITDNVHAINAQCSDERLRFILERTVAHLHDLARETRLTTAEWMTALQFLTKVGQTCTDVRQEFILLSDVLGLSLLVDSIDHPTPPNATESTVLGPFHTHEAQETPNGGSISQDPNGEPCLVIGTVKDTLGRPIDGVKIDVWETDSGGFYDVQHADRDGPDGRAIFTSDARGGFWFKAIVPVPYPIPNDGPVGELLKKLNRHPWRPSHMHFLLEKPGFETLVTALYRRGDPYEKTDAVFGVKESLIVDITKVSDPAMAEKYGVSPDCALMQYDFVMVGKEEATQLRVDKASEAGVARANLP
ncbi:hypothetical protein NLU13_7825 [Sarocladium strictum]|uniref:Intradiol ring-cleavage dioxygenases domain-containing protein n=1 Tax=Sarocladium strictum TaxID=5046 RepID=A0AA39GE78_SARSR|nr:hypothetical protein NLU13_7825 [Sarocladium strictum]